MIPNYSSKPYDVRNDKDARAIILSPLDGMSTDHRWETETPYTMELLSNNTHIRDGGRILDYGCGIGRLSRAIHEEYPSCPIVGVDFSWSMRALAANHNRSDLFTAMSPQALQEFLSVGVKFEVGICIWVLQHIQEPLYAIDQLREALKGGGQLFVVNENIRYVPSDRGTWDDDGIDIKQLLHDNFEVVKEGTLDRDIMGGRANQHAFWGVYCSPWKRGLR